MKLRLSLLCVGLLSGIFTNLSYANTERDYKIMSYHWAYDLAQREFSHHEMFKNNINAVIQGIQDALKNKPSRYSDKQIHMAMANIKQAENSKVEKIAQENKQKGELFLAENAKKLGVVTTKSGLQYKIIKQGTGKKPKLNSEVRFHYESYSIDGTMTNSSYEYNAPFKGRLNEDVLEGIAEGVQYVQEGGEIELYIPPHLAYGDKDTPFVGKNSTIIIKIKLLKVK